MSSLSYNKACKFIELISKQRDLYDPNSRYFKSINKREKIWEEIAIECNKTSRYCKNQWTKLKKSYDHFKKNGCVVTKRTYEKGKLFKLMTFLEVKKKQANENQQQNNNNVQQGNADRQQGNKNQQTTKENKQQSEENQRQDNANNIGPEVKERQGNETKLDVKTTDGLLKVQNQGLQMKSPVKCTVSPSGHTLQIAMPSVRLNISGVEMNLGSRSNKETLQSFHENSPAPKPNPQLLPQQKQDADKSMEGELHLFSTQVRATLGNLPRKLQIKAQNEVFRVLSKYKKLALSSMSVSESSSKKH